jgi:hypothetical protein
LVEVLFGGGFLLPGSEVVGAAGDTDTSWLERFEFELLGSVGEIAKDGCGEEVEHDAVSWLSSNFSRS